MTLPAREDEMDLPRDRIDGIDNIIVMLREKPLRALRQIELLDAVYDSAWVDGENAFPHRLCLFPSDRLRRRVDLPVDVREADEVIIDEDDMADAGACQSFRRIRTDTTYAEHRDRRRGELLHGRIAEQQRRARKPS